jgi:hypothetical protein
LHPNPEIAASNRAIQHFSLEDRDMKNLIIAALIGMASVNNVIANEDDFRFPQISTTLQLQIDRKLEEIVQAETFQFPKTNYVAQKQVKNNKAS